MPNTRRSNTRRTKRRNTRRSNNRRVRRNTRRSRRVRSNTRRSKNRRNKNKRGKEVKGRMGMDMVGLGAKIDDARGDFDPFDEVIELFQQQGILPETLEEKEIKRLKAARKRLEWAKMSKKEIEELILDLIEETGKKVK
jgi:hypothetical protein